jgi:methylenetetrahydrofolate reductase (NADPH)
MPPKTAADERRIWMTIRELEPLRPAFVSVTYGAGGSTRAATVAVTERIATDTTLMPVAHLTAVNHSIAQLRHIVGHFADAGINNMLALRGDPPGDVAGPWIKHPDGVEYAYELVELLRSYGGFCIGVAAFPYKHPRSTSVQADTDRFVAKCRAGADFAITQMFFDADDYLRLRDRVTAAGCQVPLIAGQMPVTTMRTISRSEQLSGAPFPPWLAKRFERVSHDPAAVRALGIEQAVRLAQRLVDEGVPGLHFITFNFAKAIREVLSALTLPVPESRTPCADQADGAESVNGSRAPRMANGRLSPGNR